MQVLLAVAAGQDPTQAVLVARDGDRFRIACTLEPPPPAVAETELERLLALVETWRWSCWPLPPRTGFTYAYQERQRPGSGLTKAIQAWEGGFQVSGEREQDTQALCFGRTLPGRVLLQPERLERVVELFSPLLDYLTWTP